MAQHSVHLLQPQSYHDDDYNEKEKQYLSAMGYKTICMHLMLGSYGFEISTVQRTKK